jgi:hypothetical protein
MSTPSLFVTTLNGTINTTFTDYSTASGAATITGTSPSPQMPQQQLESMRSELLQLLIETTPPPVQNANLKAGISLKDVVADFLNISMDSFITVNKFTED